MPHRTTHGGNMREEMIGSVAGAVAKTAPPVTVAGAIAAGASLDVVVLLLTAVYLLGQICYLAWRWHGEWRNKRRRSAGRPRR